MQSSVVIPIQIDRMTKVFLLRGTEGAILVDAGPPDAQCIILSALRETGYAPEDVRLILITHGHIDHFGSAATLKGLTRAPIAVHTLDAPALRQGINPPDTLHPVGLLMRVASRLFKSGFGYPAQIPPLEPDITFDAPWRLDEYGVAGEVLCTPGHTPGSITVLLDEGTAILGDMARGSFVRQRAPAPPFVGWNMAQNRASLRGLLARGPHTLHATHGGPFTLQALERLRMP